MLPLDAIKAPQGKKTLGLHQNRPAQGMGHREVALQPGPWDPPTHLNLEGMPTLARSRRGKGTVLTGVGPSPIPKEGREPASSFPGHPLVRQSLGKGT